MTVQNKDNETIVKSDKYIHEIGGYANNELIQQHLYQNGK